MAAKRIDVDADDLGIVDPETASAGTGEPNADSGSNTGASVGDNSGGDVKRNKDGSIRKKRGRKAGTSATSRKSDLSVNGVEKILLSLHTMAATAFKSPELMLDDSEAKSLSEGILAVQSHYNFSASAEVMAWCNLAFIVAGVYGPRIMLIRMRHNDNKKERTQSPKKENKVAPINEDIVSVLHHAPTQ